MSCQHLSVLLFTLLSGGAYHVEGHANQQLMKESGDGKHKRASPYTWHACPQRRVVDMSEHPLVHRHIPQSPVVSDGGCIPPVLHVALACWAIHSFLEVQVKRSLQTFLITQFMRDIHTRVTCMIWD